MGGTCQAPSPQRSGVPWGLCQASRGATGHRSDQCPTFPLRLVDAVTRAKVVLVVTVSAPFLFPQCPLPLPTLPRSQ